MPLDSRPQTSRPRSSRYQGPLAYRRRATIVGKDKLWRYVYVLSCPLSLCLAGIALQPSSFPYRIYWVWHLEYLPYRGLEPT
jgi:hypothetical protein